MTMRETSRSIAMTARIFGLTSETMTTIPIPDYGFGRGETIDESFNMDANNADAYTTDIACASVPFFMRNKRSALCVKHIRSSYSTVLPNPWSDLSNTLKVRLEIKQLRWRRSALDTVLRAAA
jgi:hypothetical protein